MFPQENMRRLVPDERRIVHAFQFSKASSRKIHLSSFEIRLIEVSLSGSVLIKETHTQYN